MKIKQISITEAIEYSKLGRKVYVITSVDRPVIKSFNNMPVGYVLNEDNAYIFFVFEEA